ncbi:hypothetical protein [Actinosynnema sp. NPDC023587]|uniref:hypothetical protein n=1 Tax=Actinosynnema sp. NPDC023587 TaxID=3154695 RepID=UPI0033D93371
MAYAAIAHYDGEPDPDFVFPSAEAAQAYVADMCTRPEDWRVYELHPVRLPAGHSAAADIPLNTGQLEVLHGLAHGLTARMVGKGLGISEQAVSMRLLRIRKALRATTNHQALYIAAVRGLLPLGLGGEEDLADGR